MSKSKNVPAYLALVVDVLTRAEQLGLTVERDMSTTSTLPENSGFVFVHVDGGSAAMIIPRHAGEVQWCDSHIDWEGKAGHVPLDRPNGAVICRVDPSELDLDAYLTALSGASKRKSQRASKAASQELEALKAKLQSLGLPKPQAATPSPTPVAPAADSEEELDGTFLDA